MVRSPRGCWWLFLPLRRLRSPEAAANRADVAAESVAASDGDAGAAARDDDDDDASSVDDGDVDDDEDDSWAFNSEFETPVPVLLRSWRSNLFSSHNWPIDLVITLKSCCICTTAGINHEKRTLSSRVAMGPGFLQSSHKTLLFLSILLAQDR